MATSVDMKFLLSPIEALAAVLALTQTDAAALQRTSTYEKLISYEYLRGEHILLCLYTRFGLPDGLCYAMHLAAESGVRPVLGYKDLLEVLNNYNDN